MTVQAHLIGSGISPLGAQSIVGSVVTTEAGAGTTQTDATKLSMASIHVISTAANNSGVVLPPGTSTTTDKMQAGDTMWVANYSANSLILYPPTGGKLNNGTATTGGITLTTLQKALCLCIDGTSFMVLVS